jgi:hypothetical protein
MSKTTNTIAHLVGIIRKVLMAESVRLRETMLFNRREERLGAEKVAITLPMDCIRRQDTIDVR